MNRSQPKARSESRAACDDFWLKASEPSLDGIWDNSEDDIYAELVETLMTKGGKTDEYLRRNN
jgi:hypothetical protein